MFGVAPATIRMIDGFNEDWIDFDGDGVEHRVGRMPRETVLKDLVAHG